MDLKKNPKVVYFLIFLVIVIWSVIILKVFTFESSDTVFGKMKSIKGDGRKELKKKFDYELLLNYNDPFSLSRGGVSHEDFNDYPSTFTSLNQEDDNYTPISGGGHSTNNSSVTMDDKQSSPKLEYFGMFWNTTQNRKIAILKIDGVKCLIDEGNSIKGVKLTKIENDSIFVVYKDLKVVCKKK